MTAPVFIILPPELTALYEPRVYTTACGQTVIELFRRGAATKFSAVGMVSRLEAVGVDAGTLTKFEVEVLTRCP